LNEGDLAKEVDGEEQATPKGPADFHRISALAVLIAPVLVIVFARWIFNDIIEVGRIDMAFLPGAALGQPFISSQVISSLYNFGFALCAVAVFSVALIVFSATVVFLVPSRTLLKAAFVLIVFVAFAGTIFDVSTFRLIVDYVPAPIARSLIDNTLGHLPSCTPEDSPTLARCAYDGIGNTGRSLAHVIALGFAIVLAAGLSYIMAIAVITGSTETDWKDRLRRIDGITLLAAMTFLLTIVAVHLLFQPGAEMIASAHAPVKVAEIAPLQSYSALRNAMTLYWATIFSLALGTAYFGAATLVQNQAKQTVDFGGIWNIVKALLTVLSPVIADWILKVGETFVDMTNVSAGQHSVNQF